MFRESGKGAKRKGRERGKEGRKCLGRGAGTVKVSARLLHRYWLIPVVFVFAEPSR